MSIAFAKKALQQFLSDPKPEVLCIKGKWGVGKTHAWKKTVEEALANNTLAMKKYAYISLFGIKDSSDILQSVFATAESTCPIVDEKALAKATGVQKLRDLELGKKFKSLIGFTAEHATVPHIAGLGGVARAVLSSFVGDTLVCIDDFERKGASVSVNEVMGVMAQMRDLRRCKVVLILNEDSLEEKERAEFQRYSEKVLNRTIQFLPTEAEAVTIAFPDRDPLSAELRSYCEKIGITNIRIMFRLPSIAEELLEIIKEADQDIKSAVLKSLVVLVWATLSPPGEGAPTLAYLKEKRLMSFMGDDEAKFSPEEVEWNVLLNDYGFSHCDELDLLMISGVERGFFNDERIAVEIEKLTRNTEKIRGDTALTSAWAPFHESFADNPDEVANSIYKGCIANIAFLTPVNLNGAIDILKQVGHREKAAILLNEYLDKRGSEDVFDLSDHPFGSHITDPDVIAAFGKKASENAAKPPLPVEAASQIATGGWNPGDEESLAALSVDDFVALFKATRDLERRKLIRGSTGFLNIANATARQTRIGETARAALIKIGQESPLNARRLRAYGIDLKPSPET